MEGHNCMTKFIQCTKCQGGPAKDQIQMGTVHRALLAAMQTSYEEVVTRLGDAANSEIRMPNGSDH